MDSHLIKILLVAICIALCNNFYCQQDIKATSSEMQKDTISIQKKKDVFVDIHASFMGGNLETFRGWVQRNLIYPEEAVKKRIYGKILVKFSINENGKLFNAEIYQSVHPLIDNEALRVIQMSPLWEPAKLEGKNVTQTFVMPVFFALNRKTLKELTSH